MTSLVNWFSQNFFWIQATSLTLSLILFVAIIYLVIKIDYFSDRREYGWEVMDIVNTYKKRTLRAWKKIIEKITSLDPKLWFEAVKEADVILDEVLKSSGYLGKSVEERLSKFSPSETFNMEALKEKRREFFSLFSEESVDVDVVKAKELLREYRSALQQFGMLDQ